MVYDNRELSQHVVPGDSANHQVIIEVMDAPGSGGANHKYAIFGGNMPRVLIEFQNGPIAEVGVNGLTHEALLAILIDRMEGFQAGPYACKANEAALINMKAALDFLQIRTRERIARGVEGTHQK